MSTLLLIDDDENLRGMLEELLLGEGHRVITAADGEQGVRLARAHRPDLIVSDVRMPGLDGHAALAQLRQSPGLEHTPVILMTGEADLPDMRKGMDLGADDYLAKPVEHATLLRTVDQHLKRQAQREAAASAELQTLRRNLDALLPPDLVEPLHEIVGCASVLEVDAQIMPPADVKEFAGNILAAADTLNRRFENFILFSRLESGQLKPTASGPAVSLADLVRHAAEHAARRHHRTEHLRLDLADVTAAVPREYLAKLVTELVDNACRYSLKSEPIDVALAPTTDGYQITITDHGMGLPDPLPATTGYGLRLSEHLTQALGGTWTLDNRPKRGLTLTLSFPR
ncbi:ATP-binding response regulator [Actomonas aquatica]|uniref:histidine kinase n=1 Tax=Actomonas aquatica TaxID=2866162 RepID=A0ABZ1C4K5_9BACT|nr:response regulator [Opitutus sp. WL0086]WRQ86386.1 response regulator [Opitutus sp. WL0086]